MYHQHPKYDQQIIIQLIDYKRRKKIWPQNTLQSNWKIHRGYDADKSTILEIGTDPDDIMTWDKQLWRKVFKSVTSKTRVYICGHCAPGIDFLLGYNPLLDEFTVEASWLADLLSTYLKGNSDPSLFTDRVSAQVSLLRISLMGCWAATSTQTKSSNLLRDGLINNSFAARFLNHLNDSGIRCEVVARYGMVIRNKDRFPYHKRVLMDKSVEQFDTLSSQITNAQKSKPQVEDVGDRRVEQLDTLSSQITDAQKSKPQVEDDLEETSAEIMGLLYPRGDNRSKMIYRYHGGRQIIMPAYKCKWRHLAFNTIINSIDTTKSVKKREALLRLLDDIKGMSNGEIYQLIRQELYQGRPDTGYCVHNHGRRVHWGDSKTYKAFNALLQMKSH